MQKTVVVSGRVTVDFQRFLICFF